GFAVGYFATAADQLASPQLTARGFFQTVDHPVAGRLTLPGLPYKLSETPGQLRPAPLLGAGEGEGRRERDRPRPVPLPPSLPLAGTQQGRRAQLARRFRQLVGQAGQREPAGDRVVDRLEEAAGGELGRGELVRGRGEVADREA